MLGLGLVAALAVGTTTLLLVEAGRQEPARLQAQLVQAQQADGVALRTASQQLRQRAGALASSDESAAIRRTADSLATHSDRLLAAMTTGNAALATDHAQRVTRLTRIAIGFCVTLFAVLLFEWLVVFRPATRAIGALLRDQEAVKSELYAKAEEMYQNTVQQEIQNDTLQMQQQTLLEQQEELMAQQSTLIEQRDHLEERANELSRLTAILDATPDAVAVFSLTGEVLYANASAELHLQHVRHRDWTHAAHLLAPSSVRQLRDVGFPRAIRRGLWQGEVSMRNRGSVARTMVQTLIAHRGPDGRVATVSALLQDITEQKALQVRLAEGESRNRAVIDALAEGVVVQDRAGRTITWNASARRILGLTDEQMAAGAMLDAQWSASDSHGDHERHPITRARLDAASVDGEVMALRRDDGQTMWLSVNARPMGTEQELSAPAAVATFSDITRARTAARELETLSVVARQSDHAIGTTDTRGRLTWVNPSWERLTGYALDDVLGRRPGELLQGTHTNAETVTQIRMAIRAGDGWSGEVLNYRKDGSPYWIEMTITPSLDEDGVITGYVALTRDITARRNADRERQQLAAAVAVTADGIAITGVSGALEFVNHAFARMHGHKVGDLLQTPWAALYEPAEAQRLVREAIPEVTQVGFWQGEATGMASDGSLYPQELSLTLLPHGGLVAVARDISERKATEERLTHLSVRDELTSLYNRRGFLEQADSALRLAARQGVPCALFYGDLDAFKSVNDGFGHNAGDAALKTIADILTSTFRETDLVSRLGGDEFTILAIDVRPDDLPVIMERIDTAVRDSNAARAGVAADAWHLGISLGVAHFDPDAPDDVETLLRSADEAQYEQKRQRKALRAQAA
jgi:diguanylate cyclase (GGDEF)-like protein/PAS domain S-box-containing protein